MKIVCVGHAAYDITLPMNEYPKENLKHRISKKIECGGGPASNASYLLAKWGMDTTFIGIVGDDFYGNKIIDEFKDIGVNTNYIEKLRQFDTDTSYIISNLKNGSRTIITAKSKLPLAVNKLPNIDEYEVVLLDGEHYETARQILVDNPNAISILDAGRVNEYTIDLGKRVTYLVCSKDFAKDFTNELIDTNDINSLIKVYEKLRQSFNTNIIITLGEDGCFTKINDYELIPTISVKALDSTGAGDIFHGAFTYFIANKYPLRQTLLLASITGALSVEKIGSRYAIPTLDEVLTKAKEYDYI